MVVIIPHPTEELKLINFQKKLIEQFNSDDGKTIWYAHTPMWFFVPKIDYASTSELKDFIKQIEKIWAERPFFSDSNNEVIMPILLKTKKETLKIEFPLIHKLKSINTEDVKIELLPLEFKQCKVAIAEQLHNSSTAVQSCKTSSYILKDSVWFKQAK